jgi:hypothetical protein
VAAQAYENFRLIPHWNETRFSGSLLDWKMLDTARRRTEMRDPHDWPIVAVALLLGLPIWTEDRDFFGSGVATWTSDRVELYLGEK